MPNLKIIPMKPCLFTVFPFFFLCFISCQIEKPAPDIHQEPLRAGPLTDSLFQRAEHFKATLKYDSAVSFFEAAAQHYEKQQDWEKYLACQGGIAHCLWATHRGDEALGLCQRMITKSSQSSGPVPLKAADLYTVMGNIHADRRTRKDYDKGVAYYEKALAIIREHYGEQHPALAGAYERLGIARYLADDYPAAIPFYEKALSFLEEPNPDNVNMYAKVYNNLGLIHFGMGNFHSAMDHFSRARSIIEEVFGCSDLRAVKYAINIAQAQTQMGNFEEALINLEEAWIQYEAAGSPGGKLVVYLIGSIGDCYMYVGDHERAAGYYQQCLEYWDPEKRDDINGLVLGLSRAGKCYLKLGQDGQAMSCFQEALGHLQAHYDADNLNWVEPLTNLGLVHKQRGEADRAESCFRQALDIAQRKVGERHPDVGRILLELARLDLDKGQLGQALDGADRAERAFVLSETAAGFPMADEVSSLADYIAVQELRGLIGTRQYRATGELGHLILARKALMRGMAYSDSLKMNLDSAPALQNAQRQVFQLAEKTLDCLYLLWQDTGEERYLQEAFVCMEKSKSEWLRSSARELLAREYAGIPEELAEEELSLKAQLAYYRNLKKERSGVPFTGGISDGETWEGRSFLIKRRLDSLRRELELNYPGYRRLKNDHRVATLEAVQSFLCQAGSILVTYFWGENSAFGLSVSPGEVRWKKIQDPSCLEHWMALFQESIEKSRANWQSDECRRASFHSFCNSASNLYVQLLEPVMQGQGRERLLLVPDGPLGRLPFQALLDTMPGAEVAGRLDYRTLPYLARKRPFQYAYSATLLLQPPRKERGKGYIGFSPSYSPGPENAGGSKAFNKRKAGLYPEQMFREGWAPLIHNSREVKEAAALMGGRYYDGEAADEITFKKVAAEAGILHLATHAFTHEMEPDLSALAFARGAGSQEDGQLHAYELYHLPLRAGLVVLSACNTGSGRLRKGEGVMSLSRAFHHAGCPAVVMSLWPANDVATEDIVIRFFRNLKRGQEKSRALQEATLEFLSEVKNDELASPFYWANFLAIGKDDPILMEQDSGPLSLAGWVLFTLFFLVAGLVALARKKKRNATNRLRRVT